MMGPGKNLAPARGFNLPCNPAVPDFLIRLQSEGKEVSTLILETKGYEEEVKSAAAQRWVHGQCRLAVRAVGLSNCPQSHRY